MKIDLDHEVLSSAEMLALVREYQSTRSEQVLEKILAHNERFVYHVAMKYYMSHSTGDASVEDLMQWGRMGLIRALETFEPERGMKLSTYSYHWVRQHITRFGRRDGQPIGMSVQAHEKRATIGRVRAEFEQANGREPTAEELTALTGIKNVERLRPVVFSIDNDQAHGDDAAAMVERIPDPANVELDGGARADRLFDRRILAVVDELPDVWRTIIRLHYGLDGEPQTFEQISQQIGVTRERVRQITHQALSNLRTRLEFRRNSGDLGEF